MKCDDDLLTENLKQDWSGVKILDRDVGQGRCWKSGLVVRRSDAGLVRRTGSGLGLGNW